MDLADKQCVPCRGGVPPLEPDAIAPLAAQVPDWQVVEHRKIRRDFKLPDFAAGLAWCKAQPMDGPDAYNFSKEAVIVYSMAVSAAQRARGISVNSVSPGAVETPILTDF